MSSLLASLVGLTQSPLTIVSFLPFLGIALNYYRYNRYEPETHPIDVEQIRRHYDFIVVGAGSAGAVVAARLSEVANFSVLLLEAGGDETEISDVPSLAGFLQLSDLDWKYKTKPRADRAYCQAMIGDQCNWPRGKVLGGSSVLNAMVYVRGNKKDFDYWEAQGNIGWSYNDVLPYFIKSEDNRNPYLANSPYHGRGGYLTVQEAPWRTPLSVAFVQAGQELGYEVRDINGEEQTGFMLMQATMRRGTRCSTSKAFLRPARLRRNLHVAKFAHVTKVLIDPNTKRCFGVEFVRHNKRQIVFAKKEVVLSAGSLNTPQILMLSGVGPADHLAQFNIPVLSDLPVGDNLQDHVGLGGLTFIVNEPVTVKTSRFMTFRVAMDYIMKDEGPMTFPGIEGLAFVNSKYNKDPTWPDIQFHFGPSSVNSDGGVNIRKITNLKDSVYNTVYKPLENAETWTILPLLLRPKSTGWVRLQSRNPFVQPMIEPNYFAHKEDVDVLIEGIRIALNISASQAMQRFGSRPHRIPFPACRNYAFDTDEYWECGLRQFTFTIYHPSGTTKMGPNWDPTAVVDHRLRVYGVSGLRVADAGVMPTIVNGNPNAAIIMIGEKVADMIKEDWGAINMETGHF